MFLDSTSGPYSSNQGAPRNRPLVYQALSDWHANYTATHPGYTGNLYISVPQGTNTKEQWLQQPVLLVDTNPTNRLGNIPTTTNTNVQGDYGWITSGSWSTTEGGVPVTYSWTTTGIPANWDNASYVIPTRMFTINLVNESYSSYYSLGGTLAGQPTSDWSNDYTNFVNMYNNLEYFGGILYPVTAGVGGEDAQMLLHGYASITGQDPVVLADFQAAIGTNYQTSYFSNFFSGTAENLYVTESETVNGYNWHGIFDKQSTQDEGGKDLITFTTAEFAEDLNVILDPGGETGSSVNVYESYTNQILTLRGFYSEDITFTVNEDGCIVMDINDGAFGQKGEPGANGSQGSAGSSGTSGTSGQKGEKGNKGNNGGSAYEVYVEETSGDVLSKTNWLASLEGAKGQTGQTGDAKDGSNGTSGTSGRTVNGAKGEAGDATVQRSYLLRLEYDASNHLVNNTTQNRFMTGVSDYISEGAALNSVSVNTSSAVYSVNVSFANEDKPPFGITVMAWDPVSYKYEYHAYDTDPGQLEIITDSSAFTQDEAGNWTPDIFTNFSGNSINIDVRQQYIKYGNSVAFPPPSRYAHVFLIFNFDA